MYIASYVYAYIRLSQTTIWQLHHVPTDASTETADQIRRLISFPVPLELRLGEGIISSKFFLQQLRPNFFLFDLIFFLFHEVRQETSFVISYFFISPEVENIREKINWSFH